MPTDSLPDLPPRRRRPKRLWARRPTLTVAQILAWADAHQQRIGNWPHQDSGPVADALAETWYNLDAALRQGLRGLAGGSSLARLLAATRGVRNRKALPRLSVPQILAWADKHRQRSGRWPRKDSGVVRGTLGEKWSALDAALYNGCRGLPSGTSLAQILERHRGVRNRKHLPPLYPRQIVAWAKAHPQRTGHWPHEKSGPVIEAPGETWAGVNAALREGLRGLPGGTSLFRLLQRGRGAR